MRFHEPMSNSFFPFFLYSVATCIWIWDGWKSKGNSRITCPFSRIMAHKWNRIIRGMLSMHGLPRQLQIQEVFSGRILKKMGRSLRETRHRILRNRSSSSPGWKLQRIPQKAERIPGILAFQNFWIF